MVSVFVLIFLVLTLSVNTSLLKFGNKVVGAMSLPPFLCLWYYFEQDILTEIQIPLYLSCVSCLSHQCDTVEMVNKTDGIFHDYRIYLPRKLRNKNDKTPKQSIKHYRTTEK